MQTVKANAEKMMQNLQIANRSSFQRTSAQDNQKEKQFERMWDLKKPVHKNQVRTNSGQNIYWTSIEETKTERGEKTKKFVTLVFRFNLQQRNPTQLL